MGVGLVPSSGPAPSRALSPAFPGVRKGGSPRIRLPASPGSEQPRDVRRLQPRPGRTGQESVGERRGAPYGKMRKPDGKIVLLGDMNVGKTSLLQRYMERRFPDTVSTVGGAFYLKQWRSYNISIWDTAGEGGGLPAGETRPPGQGFPRVGSPGAGTRRAGVCCPTLGPSLALQVTPSSVSGPFSRCAATLGPSLFLLGSSAGGKAEDSDTGCILATFQESTLGPKERTRWCLRMELPAQPAAGNRRH